MNKESQAYKDLVEAFKNARKVLIGGRLFIGSTAEVEPQIKAALERGEHVTENGIIKWIAFNTVFDSTKEGSARYTWDKTGNKVKVEKILCIDNKGERTRTSLGFTFKKYEDVA